MEHIGAASRIRYGGRVRRRSSSERLVAIGLGILAIVSPLIIDKQKHLAAIDQYSELDEEPLIDISSCLLPLLLLGLTFAVALSCYLDQSFTRFDPYWIYRVCGSSGGIIFILMVLALVLKCKAFTMH